MEQENNALVSFFSSKNNRCNIFSMVADFCTAQSAELPLCNPPTVVGLQGKSSVQCDAFLRCIVGCITGWVIQHGTTKNKRNECQTTGCTMFPFLLFKEPALFNYVTVSSWYMLINQWYMLINQWYMLINQWYMLINQWYMLINRWYMLINWARLFYLWGLLWNASRFSGKSRRKSLVKLTNRKTSELFIPVWQRGYGHLVFAAAAAAAADRFLSFKNTRPSECWFTESGPNTERRQQCKSFEDFVFVALTEFFTYLRSMTNLAFKGKIRWHNS